MEAPAIEEKKRIDAELPRIAPAAPAKPRRLLVMTLNVRNGKVRRGHKSIVPASYAIEQMGRTTGAYDTIFDDDVEVLRPDRLAEFDAICFNNTVGVLTEEAGLRQSLLDFVDGGKGFVGIHAAAATFCQYPRYDQFPEYGMMLGGYENGGHPWGPDETIVLTPEDADHPVNSAFGGKDFEIQDEVFQMKDHYSRRRLRVLLKINTERTDVSPARRILPERRADMDLAISWVRAHGAGRVFYTSLGHSAHIFWNPALLAHLLAGIQFALGDLEADTTPSG